MPLGAPRQKCLCSSMAYAMVSYINIVISIVNIIITHGIHTSIVLSMPVFTMCAQRLGRRGLANGRVVLSCNVGAYNAISALEPNTYELNVRGQPFAIEVHNLDVYPMSTSFILNVNEVLSIWPTLGRNIENQSDFLKIVIFLEVVGVVILDLDKRISLFGKRVLEFINVTWVPGGKTHRRDANEIIDNAESKLRFQCVKEAASKIKPFLGVV